MAPTLTYPPPHPSPPISQFNDERSLREGVYMAAKRRLEEAVSSRAKADEAFQVRRGRGVWTSLAHTHTHAHTLGVVPLSLL